LQPIQIERVLLDGGFIITVNGPGGAHISGAVRQDADFIATVSSDQVPCVDTTKFGKNCEHVAPPAFVLHGLGLFSYKPNGTQLGIFIDHDVSNVEQSGIWVAPPGRYGNASYLFPHSHSPINTSLVLSTSNSGQHRPQPATVHNLFGSDLAVNLKSTDTRWGIARGQIFQAAYPPLITHVALMTTSHGVNITLAAGIAFFAYNSTNRFLEYYVQHTVDEPIKAAVFSGGSKIFSFSRASSPAYGVRRLSQSEAASLFAGSLTVAVQTVAYSSSVGQISGNIQSYSTNGYTHAAYLTGFQTVPPTQTHYTGAALFNWNRSQQKLTYVIQTSLPFSSTTQVVVGLGNINDLGVILFQLTLGPQATTQGVHYLPVAYINDVDEDLLFIQYYSSSNYNPVLRGQVRGILKSEDTSDPYRNHVKGT